MISNMTQLSAQQIEQIKKVSKAASTDKIKHQILQHVHADGKRIEATDGYRMFRMNADIEPGFYTSKGQAVTVDNYYPNVDKIMPKSHDFTGTYARAEIKHLIADLKLTKKRHTKNIDGKCVINFEHNSKFGYAVETPEACKTFVVFNGSGQVQISSNYTLIETETFAHLPKPTGRSYVHNQQIKTDLISVQSRNTHIELAGFTLDLDLFLESLEFMIFVGDDMITIETQAETHKPIVFKSDNGEVLLMPIKP